MIRPEHVTDEMVDAAIEKLDVVPYRVDMCHAIVAALTAMPDDLLRELVKDRGCVMVPREPTPAQVHEWWREWKCNDIPGHLNDHLARRAFTAGMEAAAKVCDEYSKRHGINGDDNCKAQAWMMMQCAAQIRKAKDEA